MDARLTSFRTARWISRTGFSSSSISFLPHFMTERDKHPRVCWRGISAAMHHPLVTMITHPSNRFVPSRAGYAIDYQRLFEVAAETGTAVEIDGSPSHLDLDGPLARQAIRQGALLTIDSDCHLSQLLRRQMDLGLCLARRGWVERHHVLNAKPLEELLAVIAAKRKR